MSVILIRSESMSPQELKDMLAGLDTETGVRLEETVIDLPVRAGGLASPEVLSAFIGAGGAAFGTILTLLVQGIWRRIDQRLARQAQDADHRLARDTTLIELRSGDEAIQVPLNATDAEFDRILGRIARLREAQALIIRSNQ